MVDHVNRHKTLLPLYGLEFLLHLPMRPFFQHIIDLYRPQRLVHVIVHAGVQAFFAIALHRVRELEEWGAVFDRTKEGLISQRNFGGHRYPRLAHVGDRTGLEMIRTLQDYCVHLGVAVHMECTALDLLLDGKRRIAGLVAYWRESGRFIVFKAKAVILATGGAGKAWRITSNSWEYTGDGIAMAYRAGAELMDLEFTQFHPTGMVWPPSVRGTLVTEGVRGDGGVLLNNKNERFMFKYIPEKFASETASTQEEAKRWLMGDKNARRPPELLTRDVVYVDGSAGDDTATGYFKSPVKTLMQGMLLAHARGASVWVATGDYDVSGIVWLKGAQLFGGYAPSFDTATRDVSATGKSPTKFFAKGKTVVLNLENLSTDTSFDGFVITADAATAMSSAAVVIDASVVKLTGCTITGNALSANDTAVRVQHNGFATLNGGTLKPAGSAAGNDSTGLWADESTVTVSKVAIFSGAAPHATGVRAEASTLMMDQSSIDATTNFKTQQRATGIWLTLTAPQLTKVTVKASGAQVEGIYFEKNAAQPAGTVIQNTTVDVGGPPNPALRDWNGVPYTAAAGGDFEATFLDQSKQVFAALVGSSNTGGNAVGNGN